MELPVYRFTFTLAVDMAEVEASLVLAFFGAEALHGEAQVQLDARHQFDAASRTCVIEAETAVGQDVCRLFISYLRRELSPDAFQVVRQAAQVAA